MESTAQSSSIKVTCKRCGKSSPAEQFVLDPIYRMMVCPSCVRDRQSKSASELKPRREEPAQQQKVVSKEIFPQKKQEVVQERKPAGWDADDDFLSKTQKIKMAGMVTVQQIDHERVKYKCPGCNYAFTYNLIKKIPARCPYCSGSIQKFKMA